MGTRSTITFKSKWKDGEDTLVTIYQQYDGYISGVGHDLAKWLLKKTIINGIGYEERDSNKYANGMGCLVAQFIHDFKTKVGNLYIVNSEVTEDYNYEIINNADTGKANDILTIKVTNWDETEPIFVGSPLDLLNFEEKDED